MRAPLANREALVQQLDDVLLRGDAAAGNLIPTSGNRFELYEGTGPWLERMLGDIRGASEQVNFTSYGVIPTPAGGSVDLVMAALRDAAARGVRVTGIADQVGSGMLLPTATSREKRRALEAMRDVGVDIRIKPLTLGRAGLDDRRGAVDHRKLYEIDGRISYQGGINLVDAWMPWHDVMIRSEGPVAAQGGALLAARWRDLGGSIASARREVLAAGLRTPVDDARHMTQQLSNGNRNRRELTQAFVADARAAQDRFWLTNPYLADQRVMGEVVAAARRGVDVRLSLSPKAGGVEQTQDLFTDPLRRAWAWQVAEAGGTVHVLPSFSHAKAWIADGVANVGSFNHDRSSTVRNYENSLRTTDPAALAALERFFEHQHAHGAIATRDAIDGWRRIGRAQQLFGLQY